MENIYKNKNKVPLITNKSAAIQEILKCKNDLEYFYFTFAYIQHPIRGRIRPDVYLYLKDLLKSYQEHKYLVINKGRQLHISTTMAIIISWLITFFNDKEVLIIATKAEVAKNLIKKVRFILKNLPNWMMPKLTEDNKFSVVLENGSTCKAIGTTEDAGRSEGLSLLVIDEAAHIIKVDPEEIWNAAQPTLATGGKAVVLSSPRGIGNWFHKLFKGAENHENDFFPITLPWWVHPLRDQVWRDNQNKMGVHKASQEHDCDFTRSGDTVVDSTILTDWYLPRIVEPIHRYGLDKSIWMYKEPVTGHKYIIPADNSRGDAGSRSAAIVIDTNEMEVVCDYSGKILPNELGKLMVELGMTYNYALLIPEINYLGPMVAQAIIDAEYMNLYYTKKGSEQIVDPKIIQNQILLDQEKIAGFITSGKTRPLIVEKMVQVVEQKMMDIPAKRIIDELFTFKFVGTKPKAEQGYNDDLVMALCIGCWLVDVSLKIESMRRAYTDQMISSTGVTTSSFDSFNIMKPNQYNQNLFDQYYSMKLGNGETLDLYQMLISKG